MESFDDAQKDVFRKLEIVIVNSLRPVPARGAVIGDLTSLFFPTGYDNEQGALGYMRTRVRDLVKDLVDDQAESKITEQVDRLYQSMSDYTRENKDQQKFLQEDFSYLLQLLSDMAHYYLADERPWRNLAYFVAVGTVHIATLREQLLNYPDIFGVPDPDPAAHRAQLFDMVQHYTAGAKAAREQCLAWRKSKINISNIPPYGGPLDLKWMTVTDSYNDYTGNFGYTHPGTGVNFAEFKYQDLWEAVDTTFAAQLDLILAPAYRWHRFLPGHETDSTIRRVPIFPGPAGSGTNDYMAYFNDRDMAKTHGRITKVAIYGGDGVCALEVWYGGVSSGLRGDPSKGTVREFDIGEDEFIGGMFADGTAPYIKALRLTKIDANGIDVGSISAGGGCGAQPWNASADYSYIGNEPQSTPLRYLTWIAGYYTWPRENEPWGFVFERLYPCFEYLDDILPI